MPETLPCDRCGTFTEAAALQLRAGRRLCPACLAFETKPTSVWSAGLVAGIGAVSPLGGYVLAGVNWWRLGLKVHALLPIAALVVRVLLAFAVARLVHLPLSADAPAAVLSAVGLVSFVLQNLASMWVALLGQASLVRAQRAAGGTSPNWLVAVAVGVLPMCCLVGLFTVAYQFFSRIQ